MTSTDAAHRLPDRPRRRGATGRSTSSSTRPRPRSSTWCLRGRRRRLRGARAPTAGRRSGAPARAPTATSASASTAHDPLADQSPDRFAGLDRRAAPTRTPAAADNAYPFAYDHDRPALRPPAAPDLCVLHSAAHNWEDQGGHRGEHGSLGVVQARAPFVIAGKGVRADGLVPRARPARRRRAHHRRSCSAARPTSDGHHLAGQDGDVRADVLDLDGRPAASTSSGSSSTASTRTCSTRWPRAGEAPNVARLIEMGTAYEWGAMAGLPTVTLANHTSILTGRLPGHHGILHNAWFDRATGRAGHHQLAGHVAVGDGAPRRRRRVASTTPSTAHVPGRVHRVGQRALRRRRRLLDVRLLPPRRGAADPRVARRPAPHHRAVRAPVEGLRVVVGRRPHGRRAGRRHLERPLPRRRRTRARGSCGATSPSPTPRSTRAARTPRSRRRRSATPTPASARCSPRSSAPACSTTPRSCSSPTTAWRRPTRRCAATGTSTLRDAGIQFRDEGYGFLYLGLSP